MNNAFHRLLLPDTVGRRNRVGLGSELWRVLPFGRRCRAVRADCRDRSPCVTLSGICLQRRGYCDRKRRIAVELIRPLAHRRWIADHRGSVAIEFAMIALPLILLLVGTIEISRYTWTRLALQDAASEGARCLGLGLPDMLCRRKHGQGRNEGIRQENGRGLGCHDCRGRSLFPSWTRNVTASTTLRRSLSSMNSPAFCRPCRTP